MPVYLVGGVVRDELLERGTLFDSTRDLDLSVQGSASNLARAFADKIGAAYFLMDADFDVARVIFQSADGKREIADFARLRGESITADLTTRDFTINAMAADAASWNGSAGEVIDPFNGRADTLGRHVRAVSENVFQNDPVRLLRAARMEADLDFVLDEATERLVRRDAALISFASLERVRDELIKIIGAPHVLRNLRRLDALDLLGRVLPELNALRDETQSPPHVYTVFEHSLHAVAAAEETENAGYRNLAAGAFGTQLDEHFSKLTSGARTRRALLRLTLLLHDIGKPATRSVGADGRIHFLRHEHIGADMAEVALRRLKFSNDEIARVTTIIAHHLRPLHLLQNPINDRSIYRFFRDTGDAGVDIAVHSWCDKRATYGDVAQTEELAALDSAIGRLLDRYYHARAQVVSPPPILNGQDVMQVLGLKPGPQVGLLLEAVREAQAAGIVTTRAGAIEFIQKFDPQA